MTTSTDFDTRAATWDEDPVKHERAAAVAAGIRQRLALTAATRVLDYGCGTGLLGLLLQPYVGPLTLADSSAGMLAVLKAKIAGAGLSDVHAVTLDLDSDPLPAERFDLIVTLMTLHHIADTDRILRDFRSLLRAGGHLCVADLDAEDGSFHGPDFNGHKGFDREALARRVRDAGFATVDFTTVYRMHKPTDHGQVEFPIFLMTAGR